MDRPHVNLVSNVLSDLINQVSKYGSMQHLQWHHPLLYLSLEYRFYSLSLYSGKKVPPPVCDDVVM